jgi:hypothetical protein
MTCLSPVIPGRRASAVPGIQMQTVYFWIPGSRAAHAPRNDNRKPALSKFVISDIRMFCTANLASVVAQAAQVHYLERQSTRPSEIPCEITSPASC